MSRQQELAQIRKEYPWFYWFSIGTGVLLILFVIGISLKQGNDMSLSYFTNAYTEILSIGVTVIIIYRLDQWRDKQSLKRRLIREAGSQARNTAVSAINWMRHEDWLRGKTTLLKDQRLVDADLSKSDLFGIDMQGINLSFANLSSSNVWCSDLEGVMLYRANLEESKLLWDDFKDAITMLTF